MARDDVKRREDDEVEDKDAAVSDDALELVDEEEDELDLTPESEDDKGWE